MSHSSSLSSGILDIIGWNNDIKVPRENIFNPEFNSQKTKQSNTKTKGRHFSICKDSKSTTNTIFIKIKKYLKRTIWGRRKMVIGYDPE